MGHYSDYYAYEKEKENKRLLKQYKKALDLLNQSEQAANLPLGDVNALSIQYEILVALIEKEISRCES